MTRDRGSTSAEDLARKWVRVGNLPFGFERRQHRTIESFGELDDAVHLESGSVAHHDHRPFGSFQQVDRIVECVCRWGDITVSNPPLRIAGFDAFGGLGLDLIREDQV